MKSRIEAEMTLGTKCITKSWSEDSVNLLGNHGMKQKTEPGTKRGVKHGTTYGDGFQRET
jgi:hypothetical protein